MANENNTLPEHLDRRHNGKPVCQYWVEEPQVCVNWNSVSCTKPEASFYPECNNIGTAITCNSYDGSGVEFMCILPDPGRQVGNRAKPATIENGITSIKWKAEDISCYADGNCDNYGTCVTCTAYSPYQMGFSTIQPDGEPFTIDTTTLDGAPPVTFRMPLYYELCNLRAQLSRCRWWRAEVSSFLVDSQGKVGNITSHCTNDVVGENWSEHKLDESKAMSVAPCNGAKPECQGYTGVCWQYVIDDKMGWGDKVLAEQVLELRYYLRRDAWTEEDYNNFFNDPIINAWAGRIEQNIENSSTQNQINYLIHVFQAQLTGGFNTLSFINPSAVLTAGTESNDGVGSYPDLVTRMFALPLTPIIRTKFDTAENAEGASEAIFESNSLDGESEVAIYGDTFYYRSEIYAVNLSDPEVESAGLPSGLSNYESVAAARASMPVEEFNSFYTELACKLDSLVSLMADKFISSEVDPVEHINSCFYMGVPIYHGENKIFVFEKSSMGWDYAKTQVNKVFVGGVIGQTKFEIIGKGTTFKLPEYATTFNGYASAKFQFFPMGNGVTVDYVYDDTVKKRIKSKPVATESVLNEPTIYELGYKLYRKSLKGEGAVTYDVTMDKATIFGAGGYMVLQMPDEVSNAIKPWEIEGSIKLTYPGEGGTVEMEVFDHPSEGRLPTNRIAIRPKGDAVVNLSKICAGDGTKIIMGNVYTYAKRSFGQSPPEGYEQIDESFVMTSGDNPDVVNYKDYMKLNGSKNEYNLSNIHGDSIALSVVYKGPSGRSISQVKTKLITWVKQPYCKDVEIFYSWTAAYNATRLTPRVPCWGVTGSESIGTQYNVFTPNCGDHDLNRGGKGAMWFPYDECDSSARYNITGHLSEWAIQTMEVFQADELGDSSHGRYDMRFLGPADAMGWTCGVHSSIWDCRCDWDFCNANKSSQNIFNGRAAYRGGMDGLTKYDCLKNGGELPRFGNVYRNFIRSYRSIDNVDYYYISQATQYGLPYVRSRKWVPAYEFYTDVDITKSVSSMEYPYLTYTSDDYYDNGGSFINPLGLYKASEVDGVPVAEEIKTTKYEFEDVFYEHSTTDIMAYPKSRQAGYGPGLLSGELVSWYTYKIPETQWVWRDIWEPIKRGESGSSNDDECSSASYIGLHLVSPTIENEKIMSPYTEDGEGKHVFLDIGYPEYKWDYQLKRYTLVCDPGSYDVFVKSPVGKGNDPGDYSELEGSFSVQLGSNGPVRCFDPNTGEWLTATSPEGNTADCNIELYDLTTGTTGAGSEDWFTDVTLFTEGASTSPHPDRTVTTYDEFGEKQETYFNRGLDVSIKASALGYWPFKAVLLEAQESAQVTINKIVSSDSSTDSYWENAEPGEPYPYKPGIDLRYSAGSGDVILDFDFGSSLRLVAAVVEFQYGVGESSSNYSNDGKFLCHIPGVKFYMVQGESGELVHAVDSMAMANKTSGQAEIKKCFYDFGSRAMDLLNGSPKWRVTFRTTPTANELGSVEEDYNSLSNFCHIKSVRWYYGELLDGSETIEVYDQKFIISTGAYGNIPIHGTGGPSLLYPMTYDKSTIYQQDGPGGLIGGGGQTGDYKSVSKARSRIAASYIDDGTPIPGNDPNDLEEEQKKIHDKTIELTDESMTFYSIAPPGLEDKLKAIGASFPSWTLQLKNSYPRPLASMILRAPYSPCGHNFEWDFENAVEKICGPGGKTEVTREAVFRHVCGSHTHSSADALIAYHQGMGGISLTDPMSWADPGSVPLILGEVGIESTYDTGDVSMILPNPVIPIA